MYNASHDLQVPGNPAQPIEGLGVEDGVAVGAGQDRGFRLAGGSEPGRVGPPTVEGFDVGEWLFVVLGRDSGVLDGGDAILVLLGVEPSGEAVLQLGDLGLVRVGEAVLVFGDVSAVPFDGRSDVDHVVCHAGLDGLPVGRPLEVLVTPPGVG